MKNKIVKKVFVITILVMALIPIFLFFLVDQSESTVNNIPDYEWLSFWGTYLGACLGSLMTMFTLICTIGQYFDEQARREEENESRTREERKRLEEDKKYELLINSRPYLVIENAKFSGNVPDNFFEIERYAYVEGENLPPSKTKTYWVDFILKNIGNAPLLNLNIKYCNMDYCIDGYDDIDISKKVIGAPEILQKLSCDINGNESKRVRIILKMTDKFLEIIGSNKYRGRVSFNFVFEDITGQKIYKVATIDTETHTCIGWNNQVYRDEKTQELFCCK